MTHYSMMAEEYAPILETTANHMAEMGLTNHITELAGASADINNPTANSRQALLIKSFVQ